MSGLAEKEISQSLVVTFCNQVSPSSPRLCGLAIGVDGQSCAWLDLDFPAVLDPGGGGLTGACRVSHQVVLATQSNSPALILYDPLVEQIVATRSLHPCLDAHSIVHFRGAILVVSTGTNDIYRVPLEEQGFGAPQLYWHYPGTANDSDEVHLNGLTVSGNDLIASCFGRRQPDGSWGREGAVFQLEPYAVIQGGLDQPHTPYGWGDRLYFAESRLGLVHELRRGPAGHWNPKDPIHVGGYVRGLARQAEMLWIGVSASRRKSRSKGTANQGAPMATGSTLLCLDTSTREVVRRHGLGGFGDEIYDILLLDDASPPGDRTEALAQRIFGLQELLDVLQTHLRAVVEMMPPLREENRMLNAERESLAGANARLEEAQLRLNADLRREEQYSHKLNADLRREEQYSHKLVQQLRSVEASRLWRAAEWTRRWTGIGPVVFDFSGPSPAARSSVDQGLSSPGRSPSPPVDASVSAASHVGIRTGGQEESEDTRHG